VLNCYCRGAAKVKSIILLPWPTVLLLFIQHSTCYWLMMIFYFNFIFIHFFYFDFEFTFDWLQNMDTHSQLPHTHSFSDWITALAYWLLWPGIIELIIILICLLRLSALLLKLWLLALTQLWVFQSTNSNTMLCTVLITAQLHSSSGMDVWIDLTCSCTL